MLPLFLILCLNRLLAIEVRAVQFIGNTVPIELKKLTIKKKGNLSKEDIQSIGVLVTNEYHRKGYTTSYVSDIVIKKNGVVKVYINESFVRNIIIKGVAGDAVKDIRSRLMPHDTEVFNRFVLEKRLQSIKREFNIKHISVDILNFKNSADISLLVDIKARGCGHLYGSINYGPIYGVSPGLGYRIPFKSSSLLLDYRMGYRAGRFRKHDGTVQYNIFAFSGKGSGFFIGTKASRYVDTWESRGRDYTSFAIAPRGGIRYRNNILSLDLYATEKITTLNNYHDSMVKDYDSRLVFEIEIDNADSLLESRQASSLKYSLSGGRSNFNDNGYLISSLSVKTAIRLFSWCSIIPGFSNYYTSSDERFLMEYVFDNKLPGFFSNFTASNFKNTAGIDLEFEISPSFIYLAPFVCGGYFINEYNAWEARSSSGIKLKVLYRKLYVHFYYACEIKTFPGRGGFYLFAQNTF